MAVSDPDAISAAADFLAFQRELGVTDVPRPSSVGADAPAATPALAASVDDAGGLETLAAEVGACTACRLCETRQSVVFGSGNPDAGVMFVGEAPGREEDAQGLPFVGAAGELLTKMIAGMQLDREDVYIANVIKCRPPNNRDPQADEIAQCEPHLLRQIELIRPVVICTLGRFAAQTLLKTTTSMGRLRGRVYDYHGIKLVPTYHPAALLRNPQWKRPTWEDLKRVRLEYDGKEL